MKVSKQHAPHLVSLHRKVERKRLMRAGRLAALLYNGQSQGHTMLTKNLVILWVSSAMPRESLWCGEELCATALAAAFGHLAIKATDPRFNQRWRQRNELDTAPVVNSLAVTQV